MNFVSLITACLEKSFTTCQFFKKVLELINLSKVVRNIMIIESNFTAVSEYQSLEDTSHIEIVVELPHLDGPLDGKYKNWRELLVIETVEEKLGTLDFYNPVCLDEIFPKGKLKHLMKVVVLYKMSFFLRSIMALLQVIPHSDTLTNRQEMISTISKSLPKFFSRAHK